MPIPQPLATVQHASLGADAGHDVDHAVGCDRADTVGKCAERPEEIAGRRVSACPVEIDPDLLVLGSMTKEASGRVRLDYVDIRRHPDC